MAFNATPESIIKQNINGLLSIHPDWSRIPLALVADVTNGFAFKSSRFNVEGHGERLIRIRDVLRGDTQTFYSGPIPEGFKVNPDDIVVGMDGDFNLAWWRSKPALLNQRVCRLDILSEGYNKRFFYRALPGYLEAVNANTSSTTVKHLSSKTLNDLLIPLPPLAEQKAIADILDTLLAQVENTKARLERIPQILKRFRQSVLAAAVSGRLTEEFSASDYDYYQDVDLEIAEDKKLAKTHSPKKDEVELAKDLFESPDWDRWKLYALEQLVDSGRGIPYGIVQTGEAQKEGIPTIRCGDVKPLYVETGSLKKVLPEIEKKYARTRLRGGEVVLAIRGTVGNAAAIGEELVAHPLNISREVAMIPVRRNISPEYLALLLQSPGGYRALAEKTKGVAQRGINLADVKRFVTPLPTRSEQTEIVRRVDQLFTHADRIEQQVNNALVRVNNLTQSILTKAFRGELTEHWRKDNPELISGENSSEALLRRIEAERGVLGSKTKLKNSGMKKKTGRNMKTAALDELISWIDSMPSSQFSFDEIASALGGEYEQLKESLFTLLSDNQPMIEQKFDSSSGKVVFIKAEK